MQIKPFPLEVLAYRASQLRTTLQACATKKARAENWMKYHRFGNSPPNEVAEVEQFKEITDSPY